MRIASPAVVVGALLLGREAHAHNASVYLSSPLAAPDGFGWLTLLFLAALFATAVRHLHLREGRTLARASLRAAIVLGAMMLTLLLAGRLVWWSTTVPLPSVAWSRPVLWGLGWNDVGGLFAGWNLFVLATLLLWSAALFRGADRGRRRPMAAFATLYLVGLLPLLLSGALAHGHAGGYTRRRCEDRLQRHGLALAAFAKRHEGRLPPAGDDLALLDALEADLRDVGLERDKAVCAVRALFEKQVPPYLWSEAHAGKRVSELPEDEVLLSCPHSPEARLTAGAVASRLESSP